MSLIVRNDEQITVGITPGLVAGSSSFTFDGSSGKSDYRLSEIVITKLGQMVPLVKDTDYTWDSILGVFTLIIPLDTFQLNQIYKVSFRFSPQPLTSNHYSLVNSSFFIRDINLVNLTEIRTLERLNYFISKHETECLKKILGLKLYNAFLTESSQRMTDLIYGVGYFSGSNFERYWYGIVYDINISLVANYVYYYFQKANALQTVGTSTKASKSEAGVSESPKEKMVAAWKFFASDTRAMASFLWNKTDDDTDTGNRVYPEFDSFQWNATMDLVRKGGVNNLDI